MTEVKAKEITELKMTENMKKCDEILDFFKSSTMNKKEIVSEYEYTMLLQTLSAMTWRFAVLEIPEFRLMAEKNWRVFSKEGVIRLHDNTNDDDGPSIHAIPFSLGDLLKAMKK